MGAGFRFLVDLNNGDYLDEHSASRIFNYEQQLIHESHHFDLVDKVYIYTGSYEGYMDIQKKTKKFALDHWDELFKKMSSKYSVTY